MPCPFVALGIDHSASVADAKRVHRAKMLAGAHPDRGGDLEVAKKLGEALQAIQQGLAFGKGGCDCPSARSARPRWSAETDAGFEEIFREYARRQRAREQPAEDAAARAARFRAAARAEREANERAEYARVRIRAAYRAGYAGAFFSCGNRAEFEAYSKGCKDAPPPVEVSKSTRDLFEGLHRPKVRTPPSPSVEELFRRK